MRNLDPVSADLRSTDGTKEKRRSPVRFRLFPSRCRV